MPSHTAGPVALCWLALLSPAAAGSDPAPRGTGGGKPRLVVLTDIGGAPKTTGNR